MRRLTTVLIAIAVVSLLMVSAIAETKFLTNNTTPKTLASNEADGAALNGATSGTVDILTLSTDDGAGSTTLTTTDVSGGKSLFMDTDSMGHANDKWGNGQNWTFKFDQAISFDALTFKTINEPMILKSSAWVGDSDTTGSGWSFNGTTGEFVMSGSWAGKRDFTSAGVSSVPADTSIAFGFFGPAGGGEELTSFTITPIVIPPKGTVFTFR